MYKKYRKSEPRENDAMAHASVNLAVNTLIKIKQVSQITHVPLARLLAIAIDNELDAAIPFQYPIPFPTDEYEDRKYTQEAGKIYNYLKANFKNGIGYDMLLLVRHDIGIPERADVMQGVRELLKREMIEESTSYNPWNPKDYKVIRIAKEVRDQTKKFKKQIEPQKGPLSDFE
jgi:hypothetical protein